MNQVLVCLFEQSYSHGVQCFDDAFVRSDGKHVGSAPVLIGQMAARRFQLASSEFDPGSLLCGLLGARDTAVVKHQFFFFLLIGPSARPEMSTRQTHGQLQWQWPPGKVGFL